MQGFDAHLEAVKLARQAPFLRFHVAEVSCQLLHPVTPGGDINLLRSKVSH